MCAARGVYACMYTCTIQRRGCSLHHYNEDAVTARAASVHFRHGGFAVLGTCKPEAELALVRDRMQTTYYHSEDANNVVVIFGDVVYGGDDHSERT